MVRKQNKEVDAISTTTNKQTRDLEIGMAYVSRVVWHTVKGYTKKKKKKKNKKEQKNDIQWLLIRAIGTELPWLERRRAISTVLFGGEIEWRWSRNRIKWIKCCNGLVSLTPVAKCSVLQVPLKKWFADSFSLHLLFKIMPHTSTWSLIYSGFQGLSCLLLSLVPWILPCKDCGLG